MYQTYHIQAVRTVESFLAAITIIRRVLLIHMIFEGLFIWEDRVAGFARQPMLLLFMLETETTIMCRPALEAIATFDLVQVSVAIIEMISYTVVVEGSTAATILAHGGIDKGKRETLVSVTRVPKSSYSRTGRAWCINEQSSPNCTWESRNHETSNGNDFPREPAWHK